MIITEECEVSACYDSDGDVELRARETVEFLAHCGEGALSSRKAGVS